MTEFNYRLSSRHEAHIFVGIATQSKQHAVDLTALLRGKGYQTIDLTGDEVAKLHIRYMVGGHAPEVSNEQLYRFEFPERPGALMAFLDRLGGRWNISLFHYRNHGSDFGRVLAGFEVPDDQAGDFAQFLRTLGYYHQREEDNAAYDSVPRRRDTFPWYETPRRHTGFVMMASLSDRRAGAALGVLAAAMLALQMAGTAQQPVRFGGDYAGLEPRRQMLVDTWVARFIAATGQTLEVGPFYDEMLSLSTKTTFDAVTHALITTPLTDASGASLGDALSLVERVESVRGEVAQASGDRQFRMYVRLVDGALDTLARSQQFKRGADNTVFHKGYPISYRQQGGVPSVQISARRRRTTRRYRRRLPVLELPGRRLQRTSQLRELRRAGGRQLRSAFQPVGGSPELVARLLRDPPRQGPGESNRRTSAYALPKTPRAGKKDIDVMAHDFLNAWLVEGDVAAAMGYVSERAYACLAQDREDPTDFDRGLAPFQLMMNLKAAHDALGSRSSLEGTTVGVRFPTPGLKVVTQPHHAQFVVYAVPDDVAAEFDCESRLTPGAKARARAYGNYFGVTFNVTTSKDHTVALLWARENDYWKIVSWRSGADDGCGAGAGRAARRHGGEDPRRCRASPARRGPFWRAG